MKLTLFHLLLLLPFILTQEGYDDFNPTSPSSSPSPSPSFSPSPSSTHSPPSSFSPSSFPSSPSSPSFLQNLVEQAQALAGANEKVPPNTFEAPSFKSKSSYLKSKPEKPESKTKEDKKKDKNELIVQGKHYTPESIERLTKLLVKLAKSCGEQLEPQDQELLRSYSDVPMVGGEEDLGKNDEFDRMMMSNEIEDDLIDLGLK